MYGRKIEISPVVLNRLIGYHWPGNVRQLRNVIERMVVMSKSGKITLSDLPDFLADPLPSPANMTAAVLPLHQARLEFEKGLIIQALKQSKSVRQAAQLLELEHSTLIRKLKKLKIDYKSYLEEEEP